MIILNVLYPYADPTTEVLHVNAATLENAETYAIRRLVEEAVNTLNASAGSKSMSRTYHGHELWWWKNLATKLEIPR
ncbi:MAG: hypothetical protein XU15_C0011G0105 [candidate division NC10 bacterium CSP1-5]|nr:MAG: hypothetical protein XU15_C0011G0105 [candidate division NC10 bacterium CSP1-5]